MNKVLGIQLAVYGLVSIGLSFLAYHLSPALAHTTLVTGLIGGTLCLFWGIRAALGYGAKVRVILTLIPVVLLMLSQVFTVWTGQGQESPNNLTAATVITLVFVLSIGMLIRVSYVEEITYGRITSPARKQRVSSL
jgi:hypothetical protein